MAREGDQNLRQRSGDCTFARTVSDLLSRESLLQFRDFPIIVAAEAEEGLERGEAASAERPAEAVELGNGRANLRRVELGVACLLLDHRLFGLTDQPRLQLPIAANAGGRLGAKAFRQYGDLAA